MRRIILLVSVALVMAAMAAPAFANHEHANCIGEAASHLNQREDLDPGAGGKLISVNARHVDPGRMGQLAVHDPCEYRSH